LNGEIEAWAGDDCRRPFFIALDRPHPDLPPNGTLGIPMVMACEIYS
jgi:hypothetical protein